MPRDVKDFMVDRTATLLVSTWRLAHNQLRGSQVHMNASHLNMLGLSSTSEDTDVACDAALM